MSRIHVLPAYVANRIAAGEVVERPASVVKELLENSIDADAVRIRVDLEDGGKRLIRVTDDGSGMARDDLELAVERHATSKIKAPEDMDEVRTLGFRGEALPSIGAVSRLTITSRLAEVLEGTRVKVAFGRGKTLTAAGCPAGTVVEVEDLFLEIPARRHFLKARQTEIGHVSLTVRMLAVSHEKIAFELFSEGRELFRSRAGAEGAERIVPLLGKDLTPRLLPVEGQGAGLSLTGYVGRPDDGRAVSRALYFFLNRRPVGNRILWRAVRDAFRGWMVKGLHPVGVLLLEAEPRLVDVNVHPTKHEVRFRDSEAVYRVVYHAVRRALENGRGGFACPLFEDGGRTGSRFGTSVQAPAVPAASGVGEDVPLPWGCGAEEAAPLEAWPQDDRPEGVLARLPRGPGTQLGPTESAPVFQEWRILGQLARSYILVESAGGLLLFDQHAAHEGLLFARLSRRIEEEDRLASQPLLFPLLLDRDPEDIGRLSELKPALGRIGLEADPFGPAQVAVRAVPEFLASSSQLSDAVGDLLDRMVASPQQEAASLFRELLASLACHAAIKAGSPLASQEMEALLKQVTAEGITHCPHGRPVWQIFGFEEIERRFGRR